MTCDTMLEQMLDAEPDELLGHGDSPLAVHLRDCARCRAVAGQLVAETSALATVVAATRDSAPVAASLRGRFGRRPRLRLAAAGALAAALVTAVVLWPPTASPPDPQPAIAAAPPAPAPAVDAPAPPPPPPPAAAARPRATTAIAGRPLQGPSRTYAEAAPIAADRFVESPVAAQAMASTSDALSRTLAAARRVVVRPPAGVRAAVLQTANPNITVVWLY